MHIFHRRREHAATGGTVEFEAAGKVSKIDVPSGKWDDRKSGPSRCYTQKANSLFHATELLKALPPVPRLTYYAVETPDGALRRDSFGFYTERSLRTTGLDLIVTTPVTDTVESVSLTPFGEPMKSQAAVAQLIVDRSGVQAAGRAPANPAAAPCPAGGGCAGT